MFLAAVLALVLKKQRTELYVLINKGSSYPELHYKCLKQAANHHVAVSLSFWKQLFLQNESVTTLSNGLSQYFFQRLFL